MKHKNIPIGSLITSYHKGYFILTRIETRNRDSDLYHYVQVANSDGKPVKGTKEKCSDELWCNRAYPDQIYAEELVKITKKHEVLRQHCTE